KRLASAGADQVVKVSDAQTGALLVSCPGHQGWVFHVAFSPDGRQLASAGDDRVVRTHDAATGKELLVLRGHHLPVTRVAFGPDGRRVFSANPKGTVHVWDAQLNRECLTARAAPAGSGGTDVVFRQGGRQLAVMAGREGVKFLDAFTLEAVGSFVAPE